MTNENFYMELDYISQYMSMIQEDINKIREWKEPTLNEYYVSEKLQSMKKMIQRCGWFDVFIDWVNKSIREWCKWYFNPETK
jgi:hypothetical protein